MKNALKTLFNIKPGEEYLVALNFIQAVFLGFPRLFTLTAANSLFLENYSASHLPYIYIISNLIVPIIGITYLYFEKRMSFIKLQKGVLLGLGFILSGQFILLWWLPNMKWPTFVLLVWYDSELMLAQMLYWSVANRLFTIRQGQRLFGLIWSGEILTFLVGGFLMPYLVQFIGTVNLLLFSIGGLILALINLTYMTHVFKSKLTETVINQRNFRDHEPAKNGLISLLKNKYIILIFAFLVIYAYIIYFFVDNIFYDQLNKQYQNSEQLAGFIGQFFVLYSLLSLFFRALLSGRWIMRVGLLGGLLTLPIALSIGVIFALSIDYLLNEALLLFWMFVLIKLIDRVLAGGILFPSYYLLYKPLPTQQRTRIQTSIELVAGPFVGIFAGTFLLLLQQYFDFTSIGLSVVLFMLLLIFIVIGFLTFKEYRKALATALSHKSLADIDLPLNDLETVNMLEPGLKSLRSEKVLYCLKLPEQAEYPNLKEVLLNLINHRNSGVRTGVYQSIEKLGDHDYFKPLKKRLVVEEIPAIRAALLGALAATGEDEAFDTIQPYLNDARLELRQAAMVALIRYGGIDGVVTAGGDLKALKDSAKAPERAFAAQILGNIGISNFYRWLLPLLRDKEVEVRKAALIAAGQLNNRKLWPLVIENLDETAVIGTTIKILLTAKELAFEALELAYHQEHSTILRRKTIIHIYGRTKSPQAIWLLLNKLNTPEKGLRDDILWALHLCGYLTTTSTEKFLIEKLIHEEVTYGLSVLAAQSIVEIQEPVSLLSSALDWELEKLRSRIFYLLSFIYPMDTIMKVRNNLNARKEQRDLAIELFEHTVTKTHKTLILPILPNNTATSKYSLTLPQLMEEMIFQSEVWNNTWLRVCAIEMAAKKSMPEITLSELVSDSNELIRETAQYYAVKISPLSSTEEDNVVSTLPTIEKVNLLQSESLFSEIAEELLVDMAQLFEDIHLRKGEYLYHQGELGHSMYIVVDGLLRSHRGEKTLAELGRGHLFGELSTLASETRITTVTAVKTSHLLCLSQSDLQNLMAERIEIAKGIMQFLYNRLQTFPTISFQDAVSFMPSIEDQDRRPKYQKPLSLIEKMIFLKMVNIFSSVPDHILSDIANLTQEICLEKGQVLLKPGDFETNMYLIVEGSVQVYDDKQLIVELGERETIGGLTAFFSEPQTFSVAAIEDTRLLSVTQPVIFELLWSQHEIVQGIISVLVQRLRRLMK